MDCRSAGGLSWLHAVAPEGDPTTDAIGSSAENASRRYPDSPISAMIKLKWGKLRNREGFMRYAFAPPAGLIATVCAWAAFAQTISNVTGQPPAAAPPTPPAHAAPPPGPARPVNHLFGAR